jgi:hypothetical protein
MHPSFIKDISPRIQNRPPAVQDGLVLQAVEVSGLSRHSFGNRQIGQVSVLWRPSRHYLRPRPLCLSFRGERRQKRPVVPLESRLPQQTGGNLQHWEEHGKIGARHRDAPTSPSTRAEL